MQWTTDIFRMTSTWSARSSKLHNSVVSEVPKQLNTPVMTTAITHKIFQITLQIKFHDWTEAAWIPTQTAQPAVQSLPCTISGQPLLQLSPPKPLSPRPTICPAHLFHLDLVIRIRSTAMCGPSRSSLGQGRNFVMFLWRRRRAEVSVRVPRCSQRCKWGRRCSGAWHRRDVLTAWQSRRHVGPKRQEPLAERRRGTTQKTSTLLSATTEGRRYYKEVRFRPPNHSANQQTGNFIVWSPNNNPSTEAISGLVIYPGYQIPSPVDTPPPSHCINTYITKYAVDVLPLSSHRARQPYPTDSLLPPGHPVRAAVVRGAIKKTHFDCLKSGPLSETVTATDLSADLPYSLIFLSFVSTKMMT